MKPTIRKASVTDLDAISTLYEALCDYLEAHTNYPGWIKGIYPTREDAEKGLREEALYVAEMDGKIAGTFMLWHEPEEGYRAGHWLTPDDYAHIYVIYTLAVHPDFLHHGIADKIFRFIECLAGKEGCISIRLDVVKGNVPAERLYQKFGYQCIGTVSLGYEDFGLPWFNLYEKVLDLKKKYF